MAAHYVWTMEYGTTLANTVLQRIQEITIHNGRAKVTDPYNSSTATVSGWSPNWTTPPKVNDKVKIYVTVSGVNWLQFTGRITDLRVDYGIVQNMDRFEISCEGPLAQFGRTDLTAQSFIQNTTGTYAAAVATAAGLEFYASTGLSTASAQTYTGNALALLNDLVQMEYGHIGQTASVTDPDYMAVQFYDRNSFEAQVGSGFVDTAPGANQLVYDQIVFKSAAENYYTKVIVNPSGLASQNTVSGSAPYRVYSINTLDYTTAQALNFSQYLVNNFSDTASKVTSFSCTDVQQKNVLLHQLAYVEYQVAQKQTIKLRGTTYNVIIEGTTIHVTPDQTRYTFDVSNQDLNAYLILDDAVYGKLDNNKLNF